MTASKSPELDPETAYELLAHPHRQHLLRSLALGERRSVAELVDEIVAREHSGSVGETDRSVRRRIEIELVHDHLPRLDHHGVVDYAHESKEVALTAPIDRNETDDNESGSPDKTGATDESDAAAAILERMIDA